ncbi:MAG: hypothetical protein EB127_14050 [Alphaproteobacteria bacterium]|nr:hypothetical protein [Alphaproteobacteria bacterium]
MFKWLREMFGGKDRVAVQPQPEGCSVSAQSIEVKPEPVNVEPKTVVSEGEPWHKFPTSPPEPEKPKKSRAKTAGSKVTTKRLSVKKDANV